MNTVGVMGKGLAQEFKRRYPTMFTRYQEHCKSGSLTIGKLYLYRSPNKWVLNFPTKQHWKNPSEIEWIEAGLQKFVAEYEEQGISSVSFPQLGCGNGGLDWAEVKPLMDHYLQPLPIPVFVHTRISDPNFVPEHHQRQPLTPNPPALVNAPPEQVSFAEFLRDFISLGLTIIDTQNVQHDEDQSQPLPDFHVEAHGRSMCISGERLRDAWNKLVTVGAMPMHELPGFTPEDSSVIAQQLNRLRYIEPITFVAGTFTQPRPVPGIRFSPAPAPQPPDLFTPRATELASE
ncbi:MAG: macro domain-containing protein [Myxococcales bacterium]|nr:macro domain-containing protein [Myxococcales bacterium]